MQRIIGSQRHMSDNEHPLARRLRSLQLADKPRKLAVRVVLHGCLVEPEVLFVVEIGVDGYNLQVQIGELVGVGAVLVCLLGGCGADPLGPEGGEGVVDPLAGDGGVDAVWWEAVDRGCVVVACCG